MNTHTHSDHEFAIEAKDVIKKYSNGVEALKGITLNIPQGDFYALLGPNGAGKTTFIGMLTGLVTKTSGSISIFGKSIDTHPELTKSYIGVVPQEINFNIFERPIDIVVNQAGYYGIPRSVALPRAHDLLEKLGLGDKKFVKSVTLSGGMKRRLLIARALVQKPRLLILDEPTAGVDVELRRGMWDFLKTLTSEGVTILLTTHYLEEAEQLCKRVAIINKGIIVREGLMSDVLKSLDEESFIVEFSSPVSTAELSKISTNVTRRSEHEIEFVSSVTSPLQNTLSELSTIPITIVDIRKKSGRLEELFVKLTQ